MKKSILVVLAAGVFSTFLALMTVVLYDWVFVRPRLAAATATAARPALASDPQAPRGGPVEFFTEPGTLRGGGFGGRGNGQGFQGFQALGRGGMAALDDQQRQLFMENLRKDDDKLRALEDKLHTAQKDLMTTALDATYDEEAVRAKADAMAKIQTEITLLRAAALASLAPTLKPEQKQQLAEAPGGLLMMNMGQMGGMGGGGQRRGFANGGRGGGPGGGGFGGGGPGGGPGGGGRNQGPQE